MNTPKKINSPINFPIEQRNTAKGNPNAILLFDRPLNNRQMALLELLPEFESKVIVPKKSINMSDLSALTAVTGDEFAMFTKKNERLIIRGNAFLVNVNEVIAKELAEQGYRWSGHTHPGVDTMCLIPSSGDKIILNYFPQLQSIIYNSKGISNLFDKELE